MQTSLETTEILQTLDVVEGEYYKIPRFKKDLSLCSVEYILRDDKPVILLFCRDERGEDYIIPDHGFRPYFYVTESVAYSLFTDCDLEPVDFPAFKCPENIVRVYARKPSEVERLRNRKEPGSKRRIKTWEADILFPNRYLIDKGIFTGISFDPETNLIEPKDMPSIFRKIYVDIEVDCPTAPDPLQTPDEITIIGIYDSFSQTYTLYTTKKLRARLEDQLVDPKPVRVIYCPNERSMLQRFIKYVRRTRPDVFLSFTQFDWLYLINRMAKLHLRYRDLSRVGVVQRFGDEKKKGIKIKVHGLQFLDIQKMYYQVFQRGSKWETLDAIAERELNYPYSFPGDQIYETWRSNPLRILIKNLHDVEKIRLLDEKLSLFSYFDSIRRTIGGNLVDTFYKTRIADIMYLRLCHNKLALPSRTYKEKIEYKGGIVFPVKPGIYRNIVVFDWSAMYPSIIRCFNISFETFVSSPGKDVVSIDDKYFFYTRKKGFTVQLLERLIPLRMPYKKKAKDPFLPKEERMYYKAISDGIKAVINAIYGVYGHAGAYQKDIKSYRLYLPKIAAATTYVGRTLEEEGLRKVCEELGYDILYADTDSIFLQLKTSNPDEEIKFLQRELSRRMNEFVRNRWGVDPTGLEISLDEHFETLIFFAKKRYIGKTVDGRVIVKGLEIVRRDTAEISALAQELVANAIFDHKSRDEIIDLLVKFVEDFYRRPLEEIAIAKVLKQDPMFYKVCSAHVKAHLWSCQELGFRLPVGKRFWMAYIKEIPEKYNPTVSWVNFEGKSGKYKVEAVAWDDLHPLPDDLRSVVDWDKMLEKTVYKKIEAFLDLLGIDWEKDVLSKISRSNFQHRDLLESKEVRLDEFV